MTGMVQPDLGPPATKYKEDPIDDPVSIISIRISFLSSSCLPYRFCDTFPTSISFLSFLVLSICGYRESSISIGVAFLEQLDVYHAFGVRLLSILCFVRLDLVQGEQRCESVNQKTAANSAYRAIEPDSGRFGVYWP
ncbi:hypothetical protein VN97_g12097 [Penicillium thymicola]|uniref:Uncharacterized protein n=1 Tax=Penicillium thymicola TaxID=293382 RepID=A0AAI9T6L5_PENTH|nr:hypothetical protein VN97_g12097 [Penicillium thymicola]